MINTAKKRSNWIEFLKLFSEQNLMRPTRLGVFEGEPGEMRDYWLEDGLPLTGIDVDNHGDVFPDIEIMLGGNEPDGSNAMTHTVRKAQSASIILSSNGEGEGLEIKDAEGNTTFLRFENEPGT